MYQGVKKNIFFTVVIFLAMLDFGSISLAGVSQGYVPPSGRGRAQRTEGGGSRGCDVAVPVSLKLLVPNDHTPTTVSGHPTFLWYMSDTTATTMIFTLVEPGVVKPILEKQIKANKPGIVRLDLPADVSELEIDKEYRWTVSIICNSKRPSEDIYARAWIKRVPKNLNLAQDLTEETDDVERAKVYARSGIWMDAISTIYEAFLTNLDERVSSKYFQQLLTQVGLYEVRLQARQSTHVFQRQNILSCNATSRNCFANGKQQKDYGKP